MNKRTLLDRIEMLVSRYDSADLLREIAKSVDNGATFEEILTFIEIDLGIISDSEVN